MRSRMSLAPPRRRPRWQLAALCLTALVLAACGGGGGGFTPPPAPAPVPLQSLDLRTVNSRADLVSGNDAMVEIVPPAGATPENLKVTLNGTDVSGAFARRADGRITGLLTGLGTGDNTVVAQASNLARAQLVVTNAGSAPVLSGARVTPFYCATPTPQPASGTTPATNGSGMSGQADANCNIPAEYTLYYRTTATAGSGAGQCSLGMLDPAWNSNGVTGAIPAQPSGPANPCWKIYASGTTPADMATTTTDSGVTMPYIVRLERGTLNRGIYDIVVLYDPTRDWSPTAPQAGWNGKVYYSFGVSTGQPRRQARTTINWTSLDEQLKRGWLVAQNSMTDSSRNSNRVLMSETTMMMKEHIGDAYGRIKYTLGTGCSGGSINSNMNLSINPGVLDGVVTSCTYPDSETTSLEVGDCTLLVEAYRTPAMMNLWTNAGLTQAQINARKGAINGHPDQTGCQAWYNAFGSNGKAGVYFQRFVTDFNTGAIGQSPTATNNCELPNSAVYDPNNPATVNLPRCNAWSWASSIWGLVPGSTAARDTRDNVGVQYGLKALLAGAITPEEFVTLNEVVGGIDRDNTPRTARSSADPEALAIAYRSGIVASGKNLAKAPIIDLRGWDDSNVNVPPGQTPGANSIPIHHQWYSWAIRDRITRDAGDANNQALWRFARTGLGAPGTVGLEAFQAMDQWLAALVADTSTSTIEQKVRATRPASTRDFCIPPSDATQTTRIYDMATCDQDPFLKPAASPRQVAGGPRAEDVLKCQLKPQDPVDYLPVTFSNAQWARLQAVFSSGVCDWSKPGVAQQAAVSPLTFKAGAGGQPLPAAPVATH